MNRLIIDGGSFTRNNLEAYWEPDSFPVEILIDTSMDMNAQMSVLDAVEQWNSEVGRDLFVPVSYIAGTTPTRQCGWIIIAQIDIQGEPFNTPENWDAFHQGSFKGSSSKFCGGLIVFDQDLNNRPEWLAPIAVHELGHGLGLAHDPGDPRSIMYPHVRNMPQPQVIRSNDIIRVQSTYDGTFVPGVSDVDVRLRINVSFIPIKEEYLPILFPDPYTDS
jgi:hypothetical protein